MELEEWPTDPNKERAHLKKIYRWTDPQLLQGIEQEKRLKACWEIWFDRGDGVSPKNGVAQRIVKLMPSWEKARVPQPA